MTENVQNKLNGKIYLDNIFILDWDDTLFPTTWVKRNNIKKFDEYNLYFLELDNTLYKLLEKMNNIGHIYIVSNATQQWIKNGLKVLPVINAFIDKHNIDIISARDIYTNKNVAPNDWKTLIFRNIININVNDYLNKNTNTYLNIVSLGDADFEYNALIETHKHLNYLDVRKYFLKNIRFIEYPTFNSLIEQIDLVSKNIVQITNKLKYVDLNLSSI